LDGYPVASLEGEAPVLHYVRHNGDGSATNLGAGPPVAAGRYTVTAYFPGSAEYAPAGASADFSIGKATPAASIVPGEMALDDGQPHGTTGAVVGAGGVVLSSAVLYTDAQGNVSSDPPVARGKYTAAVSFAGNDNYYPASATTYIGIDAGGGSGSPLYSWDRQLTPVTGSPVWEAIPDPSNPGGVLPSLSLGSITLVAIQTTGSGQRTATWTFTGLNQGYYRVVLYYQANPGNASLVAVRYKTTTDTAFKLFPARLDLRFGTPSTARTTPIGGWVPVCTNLTPSKGEANYKTYIWVDQSGEHCTLSIRIDDRDCGTPSNPGGLMVAGLVGLTFISGFK
jgi:hypothetical protein